jgi:hypothetical protein
MASSKTTKTDKEREAEEAGTVAPTTEADPRDPLTQPNFGMPEGVSTDASRGELDIDTTEPQELPNPTVEEQESSAVYKENHGIEGQ